METENKKAVIYCRVSTREQVEEGNSLVTQEKICKEYALKNSYDIAHIFVEQGESAKTADRTELKKLLTYCADKKNNISAVITYKLDRISRNTDDYSQIRILLKRYKVEIKSTSEYFENTPAGRFMENIIANVAQFDNDVRTERSVNGLKEAMREGRYVWIAPYGYDNVRVLGKATITQNEKALVIRKTFEEVAKSYETSEVVRKKMTEEGLVNKLEKPISKSQFYRILKNEVYTGWIIKFGERHKGLFEPIITEELFEQVQRVLRRRGGRSREYNVLNPDFPLRRFVTHSEGWRLTGCWSQGRRQKYPYYRYRAARGLEFKKSVLEDTFKSFMDQYCFNEQHFGALQDALEENLVKATKEKQSKREQLNHHITDLKERQGALIQKNLQGVISDTILRQQLENIGQEMFDTEVELSALPERKTSANRLIEFSRRFLKSPSEIWAQSSFSTKIKLQWFEFPKGVHFDGHVFRTTEICRLFKAKEDFLAPQSHSVALTHQISNNTEVPNLIFWDQIQGDLERLVNILSQTEDKPP